MGHDDHGHAIFRQFLHNGENFADHFRVQSRGGFIEQQDIRLHGQGTGNGNTLLLPAGQAHRVFISLILQAHTIQKAQGVGLRFFLGDVLHIDGRGCDILHDGHIAEQVEILEYHADLLADLVDIGLLCVDLLAFKDNLTGGGFFQAVEAADEGAFAGAGGADDSHYFALMDIDIDAVEDFQLAEMFFQAAHFQQHFVCLNV